MKKTGFLRSVAFLLILCFAVAWVMHCYSQPKYFNTRFINTFDEMPDNMLSASALEAILCAMFIMEHANNVKTKEIFEIEGIPVLSREINN